MILKEVDLQKLILSPRVHKYLPRTNQRGEDCEMNSDSTIVNVKSDATKRFLIHRAPPILTIHIKRFSPNVRVIIVNWMATSDSRKHLILNHI